MLKLQIVNIPYLEGRANDGGDVLMLAWLQTLTHCGLSNVNLRGVLGRED